MERKPINRTYLILPVLLAVVFILYFGVIGHDFISLDDNINVTGNPYVANFSMASLKRFWQEPYQNLYVPMTYSFWGIEAKLSALPDGTLDPHIFHAGNLLFHLLAVMVVFLIINRLVANCWAAAGGALLFAIHPVQVEPVAWVTGMKDVFSGCLFLAALWQYFVHLQTSGQGRVPGRHYWLAAFLFLLAMLAKPSAVVLPVIAGGIGFLILKTPIRRLLLELLPWMGLTLPVIYLTRSAQGGNKLYFMPAFWQRFLVAGDAVSFYLYKLLWPISLAADYGRNPESVLDQPWIYLTGLAPYVLVIFLIWKGRKNPTLIAIMGTFILCLLPVLGFVSFDYQIISTTADRYLYSAMLAPALGIGWLLSRYQVKPVQIIICLVLVGLGIKTWLQIPSWQNSVTTYQQILAVNPKSWTALGNLGFEMQLNNQPEAAMQYYKKVLAIRPNSAMAYNNIGIFYKKMNQFDQAAFYFQEAIRISPDLDLAHINLGDIYTQQGNDEAAIASYRRALEYNEQNYSTHNKLGALYHELGRLEEAKAVYRAAIVVNPFNAEAYNELGVIYNQEGRKEMALSQFRQALAIDPTLPGVYGNMGNLYTDLGEYEEARSAFKKALEIDPGFSEAYASLGYIEASLNQLEEAIRLFRMAIAIDPNNPNPMAYNGLSMVLAETGRASEAVEALNKAIAANPDFAPLYNNLSIIYLQMGDVAAARAAYNRAVALGYVDPEQEKALRSAH